ncbi:PWWP domain-containing protein 2A-like [Scleropages formosus]|uniref:PWWP domain containing 2A n=1 Tax=Scleropages formosus TaxID=113540 RepID=A0A8C9VJ75_SCLFO|nr:PWWP domain-containing protein 2A [Scleropages formosus]
MAAVAAEPGASAAATTTAGEGAEPEWETAQPLAAEPELKAEAAAERVPGMDLACLCEDGDAAQECSVAPPREAQCSAVPEAGGRAHCHREEDDEHGSAGEPGASRSVTAPTNPGCEAEAHHQGELDGGAAERSAPLSPAGAEPEAADEVSGGSPGRTGLVSSCSPELETAAVPLETEELAAPALLLLCATESWGPEGDRTTGSAAGSDAPFTDAGDAHRGEDAALGRAPAHTATGRDSPRGDARTDPAAVECEAAGLKLAAGSGEERGLRTEPIAGLIPGSEVRVSLDHIIDDALVVSFRLGEKVFSGVLMDLSKRFGPYGIPVTVFPKREYRDKPEPMQLKTDLLPSDAEKGGDGSSADLLHTEPSQVSTVPTPSPVLDSVPDQWTLKPPPLFQEGAPYPPPLFIRDTYSQSIPQPPPRKIKRPKRKLYREEPTSIMSAIKLRPRQVLCDKCKGAVVGDKREVRKAPAGDCRGDEAKRRRGEGAPAVGKRPRTDPRAEERGRASEGSRVRVSTSTGQAKANNVVKVVTSSTSSHASNSRVQLNTKKVLQSKNVDHSKAREVLKMAKEAHRRQRDKVGSGARARTPMTRASSLQDQKVHFTRRLHQISGGAGGGNTAPLPPRIRIKPQRYRNEENNSSPYKPPGFEKVPGSRTAPKPAAPRCTSTRSSSSCSGGVATAAAAESHGLTEELEPELSPQVSPHSHSHSHPELEPSPIPKPFKDDGEPETEAEETGGREERREKRGPKAGNLTVYMSLHPGQPDSSSVSVCSVDSADDLKSSNSECSSTETLDFPPPGALHSPPVPSTSSIGIASSTTSSFSSSSVPKEEKKSSKPLKTAVFSKNVSKCVTADGRTICVGDIVWAKIYGFPWWPARILVITVSRKDNGLLVRQEARISWFGSPTTSFLALSQVTPFLENFQSRFDKKRKGLYRKAIAEAAKAAKQLTPEVRALLTQFET